MPQIKLLEFSVIYESQDYLNKMIRQHIKRKTISQKVTVPVNPTGPMVMKTNAVLKSEAKLLKK